MNITDGTCPSVSPDFQKADPFKLGTHAELRMLVLCGSGPESRLWEGVSPPFGTAPSRGGDGGVARNMAGGSLPPDTRTPQASF